MLGATDIAECSLSAPGKLFLAGEYAVLWGGIARIAAVGERAFVHARRRADHCIRLQIGPTLLMGELSPHGVQWQSTPTPLFHFATQTVALLARIHGVNMQGIDIALTLAPNSGAETKLGFGGSARTTVLVATAVEHLLGDPVDALKIALAAHYQAQGQCGSGGDVVASDIGGVIRYQRYPFEVFDAPISVEPNAPEPSLLASFIDSPAVPFTSLGEPRCVLAYAYSGKSASTRHMLAEIEQSTNATQRQDFVAMSNTYGKQLEQGMLQGDLRQIRDATDALQALLRNLGPIETAEIAQILAIAKRSECAGKLSGAGGGDGCELFGTEDSITHAIANLNANGFAAFRLDLQPGVRHESELPG